MRDGLSQMKVSSFSKGPKGYYYIGTRNGLNQFNGSDFKVFRQVDGLSSNRIHQLKQTSDGRLAILTSRGLDFYNGQDFESFPYDFPQVDYLMFVDQKNRIWITTRGELTLFDHGEFRSKKISNIGLRMSFDHDNYVLYSDVHKKIKVNDRFEVTQSEIDPQKKVIVLSSIVENISYSGLYYTEKEGTLKYYYQDQGEYKPILDLYKKGKQQLTSPVYININNKLFLLNKNGQLSEIGLYTVQIHALWLDEKNRLWVGGDNGFDIISDVPFSHFTYDELPYIWTVIDDLEGNVLFGSYGYGLYELKRNASTTNKIKNVRYNLFHAGSCRGSEDELYFANNAGICRYNQGELNLYNPKISFDVVYDKNLNWLVSATAEGICMIRNKQIVDRVGTRDGFHDNFYIQTISIDTSGHYWCGSYQGVSRYNPKTSEIQNFTSLEKNLPLGPGVFSCFTDINGVVWIGGENGLMHYDEHSKRLLPVQSELMKDQIKSICDIDENRLLLAAKNQLYLFNTRFYFQEDSLVVYPLNQSHGYSGVEPGFNGIHKTRKGDIFICSATTVDVLDTSKLSFVQSDLGVRLTQLNDGSITENILLNDIRSVVVQAEAIGLYRPNPIQYSFKIDDQPWTEWRANSTARFIELTHGEHKISVAAGPVEYIEDATAIDHVMFKVNIPFYKRGFFIPSMTLLILCLLFFWIRGYWRNYRDKMALEKAARESQYLRSQLLLSELNPHFIFNVIASIQNKVLKGDKEEASQSLAKLSTLIRKYLESTHKSNKPHSLQEIETTLEEEVKLIETYIQFEQETNNFAFDYKINIDENIDLQYVKIPPMFIQPFVENSIKHGLLPLSEKGHLAINIGQTDRGCSIEIVDNGVGFDVDNLRPKTNHTSYGLSIISDRINALNALGYDIKYFIDSSPGNGSKVRLEFVTE